MHIGRFFSRNILIIDRSPNLVLPSPTIQAEWSASSGALTLRLQSPALARHVYVSFGDNEVELSDNYFDLLPGEGVTLQLKSKADIEQLKRALRIRNIADAFPKDLAQ